MTVKYKVGIRNLARSIILQNQPKNLDVAYKKKSMKSLSRCKGLFAALTKTYLLFFIFVTTM